MTNPENILCQFPLRKQNACFRIFLSAALLLISVVSAAPAGKSQSATITVDLLRDAFTSDIVNKKTVITPDRTVKGGAGEYADLTPGEDEVAKGASSINDSDWKSAWVFCAGVAHTFLPGSNLAVTIKGPKGNETFPCVSRAFPELQDFGAFTKLRFRLKITVSDPTVRQKSICFLIMDDTKRIETLADRPMEQQFALPVTQINTGEWVTIDQDISAVTRGHVASVAMYMYKNPPDVDHDWTVEVAELSMTRLNPKAMVFDNMGYLNTAFDFKNGSKVAGVTGDGLALEFDASGRIVSLLVNNQTTTAKPAKSPAGILLNEMKSKLPPVAIGGTCKQDGVMTRINAPMNRQALVVDAVWKPFNGALEVSGTVSNMSDKERGVTVYVALPVEAFPGITWSKSLNAFSDICSEYERNATVEYMNLRYPLAAVNVPGKFGITIGIRMDKPQNYRLFYNPREHTLAAAFDIGLMPTGKPHDTAPFSVVIYNNDPAWGLRASWEKYYAIYPEFFKRRLAKEGGPYCWGTISRTPGWEQAGFQFHWGPANPEGARFSLQNGLYSYLYIEAEDWFMSMGDMEKHSYQDAITRLNRLAEGNPQELANFTNRTYNIGYWERNYRNGEHNYFGLPDTAAVFSQLAASVKASAIREASGKITCVQGSFDWIGESRQGTDFLLNLSPKIPKGMGWFNKELLKAQLDILAKTNVVMSGVALDVLYSMIRNRRDYNTSNFVFSDSPLSFDTVSDKAYMPAHFPLTEWLKDISETIIHPYNRSVMANIGCDALETLIYGVPYLDIFMVESGWVPDPEYQRAITGQKALVLLYTGEKPPPESELQRLLLFGIWPGWGQDVSIMAKYIPLFRTITSAGWQSVTHARTDNKEIAVERFGGAVPYYFSLANSGDKETTTTLKIDKKALGLHTFGATVQLKQTELKVSTDGSISVVLAPRETVVIEIK